MTLNHDEFLQLSRIAECLRRSDPEMARKFARPMGKRRPLWVITSYVTLVVCALLMLVGAAMGDTSAAVIGGLAMMTIFPFVLIAAKKGQRNH
jgi:acetyl-CoA carboxylase alpha subunit